ncbi:MAG: pseudouridine synthase [Polaromonas sp. 39-63-25]|nr:MAG: pseudouridine synthase [Polaromonas sp. 35-63-35]OYZ18041.1 MAG: pseudouridine synthase [Polaromonas sp. 16-63-31]OYZ79745.1 MAG: pseudouridine synthase [Polaromonas sp. 24-63-21]OZA50849.1 MAG: pseudouridine synthase [Polaromonas sp. 17-63-33]OZA86282.1 MAG: pseudouridine synthase [Polaromonas sp. 39-63-25]
MGLHGLPARDGVSPSCVGLPAGHWPTITDFLVERFPAIAREVWLQRMHDELVVDEFGEKVSAERAYRGHMRLYYYRSLPAETRIPFDEELLFQDEHLVVVDKPHFLPVTPSGHYLQETLLVRLKNRLGIAELSPIHRIDRETAGLVLFSVQAQERAAYQDLFRQREVSKGYEAIAPWRPELTFPRVRTSRIVEGQPFFRQAEVAGAANSETRIELLEVSGPLARYGLSPVTGKKHQLRVHMYALGLPIVNDRVYPPLDPTPEDDYRYPLQLLAKNIAFDDPFTGERRQFSSKRRLELP